MMKKNESTGRGRTNGIYQVTKDECERCVRDALEVGYRSIDTAQSYFNEEEVGKAIEKSGIYSGSVVKTKIQAFYNEPISVAELGRCPR